MEKKIDYIKLYQVQDIVLNIVFGFENNFYLTGGTALHRFYYNLRYSDDLDFFAQNDKLFSENVNQILDGFSQQNLNYKRTVQSKDFQRVLFSNLLQLDFVNDSVYRHEKSVLFNNLKIDNVINILTNKIAAILSRDEEKDVFDLIAIAINQPFMWNEVIAIANKKAIVDRAWLIERINSFPLEWFGNIKKTNDFLITKDMINIICDDIKHDQSNNLYSI